MPIPPERQELGFFKTPLLSPGLVIPFRIDTPFMFNRICFSFQLAFSEYPRRLYQHRQEYLGFSLLPAGLSEISPVRVAAKVKLTGAEGMRTADWLGDEASDE